MNQAGADSVSNWALIRRLLRLGWRYRRGCLRVLLLQGAMLAIALCGLGLTGLGIDVVHHHIDPTAKEREASKGRSGQASLKPKRTGGHKRKSSPDNRGGGGR